MSERTEVSFDAALMMALRADAQKELDELPTPAQLKERYPDEAIKTLARCFYPSMVEFFNSEEGQREYEEWLKEQEALQALPVAA